MLRIWHVQSQRQFLQTSLSEESVWTSGGEKGRNHRTCLAPFLRLRSEIKKCIVMNGKNKGFTRVFTLHFALTRHLQHSSSTFGVDLQAASQTPPFQLCLPPSFSPARSTSWQENRYGLAAASRDSSWSCYLDKTGRRHHSVTSSGSGDSACCVRQELSRFFTPEILPGCSREKGYIAFREKACAESLCEQRERDREES